MTESISGIARAINRFDDHQAVHSLQTPNIHWVVSIIPMRTPHLYPPVSLILYRATSYSGIDIWSPPMRRL